MAVAKTEIPKPLKDKFKEVSKKLGRTESAVLREIIHKFLNSQPPV